jgi:phospho-N-acetylmuramoyl-pentapeptide-transferase
MLYWLTELLQGWLDDRGLFPLVMVMYQQEFRAFGAVLLSFVLVLAFGRRVIRWLARQKIGDAPEFYNPDLNALMASRAGTPTMGGILIIGAIVVTVALLGDVVHNRYVHLAMILTLWLAFVGGIDDWLKLTASRRNPGQREGLFAWEKLLFQLGIGALVGFFLWKAAAGMDGHVLNLPFQRTYPPTPTVESIVQPPVVDGSVIVLGVGAFTILAMLVIAFMSNAVNITDGMDGLAPGNLVITSFALMVIAWIAGSPRAAYFLMVPHVEGTGELMVVAGAMAGACLGFLWFNCSPASVFMGDTGSLPMGGLVALIAVATRQEALLPLVGGIYIIEISSVMLQTGWFKFTKRAQGEGRRIFRCAPIHHHFHLGGWKEQQVVTRFYIISVVLAMLALASLKLR